MYIEELENMARGDMRSEDGRIFDKWRGEERCEKVSG